MMASSIEPPAPLKNKLTQIGYLLDGASKRLQEEASKCEIFATKASASGSSYLQNKGERDVPKDLARTMSDISTLKSVLSCPIFNRIVNVTDSLDKLSHQLNLHPSIGPADIDIDANGELILTPPIEPTAFNNLVNSKLEKLAEQSANNSPHFINSDMVQSNNTILQAQVTRQQPLQTNNLSNLNGAPEDCGNGFGQIKQSELTNNSQHYDPSQKNNDQGVQNYMHLQNTINSSNNYIKQNIATNDVNKINNNSNKSIHQDNFNLGGDTKTEKSSRLFEHNGNFLPDRVVPNNNIDIRNGFQHTQSTIQNQEQTNGSRKNGYSNEMYGSTNELNQQENMTIDQHRSHMNGQQYNSYSKTVPTNHNVNTAIAKVQALQNAGIAYNRGSCSPSTSAGSTVRLADECDSGASSYQSQTTKATSYSPFLYKTADHDIRAGILPSSRENRIDSMERELIENLSPELERIQVTLEKEDNSLGITIAGYTCEKEEISGIFIKSITPNSPADRSGKIRTLDQISAVNGRELLGYSNPDAVNVLRNTGKVVTLQLMRYLAESKYRKLETAVANAESVNSTLRVSQNISAQNLANATVSPTKSSIPVSRSRDNNQSPTKPISPPTSRPTTFVEVSNGQQLAGKLPVEAIYKNETVLNTTNVQALDTNSQVQYSHNDIIAPDTQSHIPVAAQRGGTNKVIETKQGARNTIDIRSPVCQTNTATYANKIADIESSEFTKRSMTARLQREVSDDEFRRIVTSDEPEWEQNAQIIELYKDTDKGLGFTVKEYANPKDQKQSIIMITSLTIGGIAERDGRLSFGDLLIFVDDTNLQGASLADTVKALKKTNGQVRLGVLKLKRS